MAEEAANVHVTSALPDDIRESVAVNNIKTLGESVAFWTNALMQEYVASTRSTSIIRERLLKSVVETDPTESVAIQKVLSGNDLAQQLGQLGTIIAQLQQAMKGAQTTPPVTG